MSDPDLEFRVTLRDGTRCLIRPIRPEDKERLRAGMQRLSPRSRYLRFNAPVNRLTDEQLRYLTEVDYEDRMAWVALEDDGSWPGMGVARYDRLKNDPTVAEAAVTVLDEYQGRGLGTVLLAVLGQSARRAGITTFRSYLAAANDQMLELLEQLGAIVRDVGSGLLEVDYPLPSGPDELPDTPAGRVIRSVAKTPFELGLSAPVWVSDEGDSAPDAGTDLDRWLDVMLPEDEPLREREPA